MNAQAFAVYDVIMAHWCSVTGLVILILTSLIALGTLAMLVFYDDSEDDEYYADVHLNPPLPDNNDLDPEDEAAKHRYDG